jgi:hypothetical protein
MKIPVPIHRMHREHPQRFCRHSCPCGCCRRQGSSRWRSQQLLPPLNLSHHLPSTRSRSNSKKPLLCEKARSPGRDARLCLAFDSGRAGNAVTGSARSPPHQIPVVDKTVGFLILYPLLLS